MGCCAPKKILESEFIYNTPEEQKKNINDNYINFFEMINENNTSTNKNQLDNIEII